mmetsp:Transcript_24368/g.34075  ORF Transcript_24368/g.34075 Transcript_24368/m.34075 type:complete len:306 (+) Transcript_24368:153-1070(+)|eukprot:CAMPEP_0185254206 /NCGR_PEP_ID=MMETSP1359-20130426/2891_1 /TAXON_ID=552665 /ORGANISM="Bigelowiella longifila, Strain CCMP242" /LENGTH=305 /DNA_ID=CAMNT_0027836941 /DNA_START=82 /DNA_END=999 /DNA_ORIENTATION=+
MGGTQASQEAAGDDTDDDSTRGGGSADERSSSRRKNEEKERSRKQRAVVPTLFQWPYGGREVFVVGSFNNWKGKVPMKKNTASSSETSVGPDEVFTVTLDLPTGRHGYYFLVDDTWQYDPQKAKITNRQGKVSNLVEVRESRPGLSKLDIVMDDDPESYGQETPKEFGAEPPALPPQFSQALNFDFSDDRNGFLANANATAASASTTSSTDAHCSSAAASTSGTEGGGSINDANVQDDAHRPLHVQLNHTCSVKRDNENDITRSQLSVLGMIQRYKVNGLHDAKDRFVTTLYYKPSSDGNGLMAT